MRRTTFPHKPYLYIREIEGKSIAYYFETDRKVRYVAYFSDYSYMFGSAPIGCLVYNFNLFLFGTDEIAPPKRTPPDHRIAATVQRLFSEFFEQVDNAVVAVYDSIDGKAHARQRKFDQWFETSGVEFVEKYDFAVDMEDYPLISSLFVHVELPSKTELLRAYQELLEGGNIPLD